MVSARVPLGSCTVRHFFLPVTVCALAQCAGREHAKAMRERIDGEVQKRWRRSAALVSAAADGDEDRVRTELINYAHPDSADSTSVTALDAALNGNHPRVVSLLLAAGSNPVLYWDRAATAGEKDFEMLMRAMMP